MNCTLNPKSPFGRSIVGMFLFVVLIGCANGSPQNLESASEWRVNCTDDIVRGTSRCFAGTFGRPANSDGQPFNSASIPFQVYYEGGEGPFVMAGLNTFPGEKPLVRFDSDQRVYTVPDDAGVSVYRPAPEIVERMRTASIAYVAYYVWPEGRRNMVVELDGALAALQQLDSVRRQ